MAPSHFGDPTKSDQLKAASIPPESLAQELLKSCRLRTRVHLLKAADDLISAIDDELFTHSESIRDKSRQTEVFDAMRDFRLGRERYQSQFTRRFSDNFIAVLGGNSCLAVGPVAGNGKALLQESVGDPHQLTHASILQIVSQSSEKHQSSIDSLIAQVCEEAGYETKQNPIGPAVVGSSFGFLMEMIAADLRMLPLTTRLFASQVLPTLQALYADTADYLPLLVRKMTATAQCRPAASRNTREPLSLSQIIDELTRLQKHDLSNAKNLRIELSVDTFSNPMVCFLRHFEPTEIGRGLRKTHELAIELSAMLFDNALDGPRLAAEYRPIVGRLQIPLLKVAVLDASLFAKKNHPARRLLSQLLEIGQVWRPASDPEHRVLNKVRNTVAELLRNFDRDISIFAIHSEQLKECIKWTEQQHEHLRHPTNLPADRSHEINRGLARLETSKRVAKLLVQKRLGNRVIPQAVRDFIERRWTDLLVVTHFKEGDSSRDWHFAVKSLDALLWSIQPKASADARDKLKALVPSLKKRLSEGARRISMPEDEIGRFLNVLSSLHEIALMNTGVIDHVEIDSTQRDTMPPDDRTSPVQPIARAISTDQPDTNIRPFPTVCHKSTKEQQKTIEYGVEEIILSSDEDWRLQAVSDESLAMAQNLTPGAWLHLLDDDGNEQVVRLVWINKSRGTYLFADRKGKKVAEKSLTEIAIDLKKNRAALIEEPSFSLLTRSDSITAD